jgi:phosphoribosylanthranilate isomerase
VGVKVKICGLKTSAAMGAALDAGADYVGLVFFPGSPRNVRLDQARELARQARGRALSVALLVDPDDALVDTVLAGVEPDMLQLHGEETPERLAAIRLRAGRPVIKAVKVAAGEDVRGASPYFDLADLVLFDAKAPPTPQALPGGNGLSFDWRVLAEVEHPGDFMLAGGLHAGNVRAAIAATGAFAVDASSGLERAPGEKDEELVRRFVRAVKSED